SCPGFASFLVALLAAALTLGDQSSSSPLGGETPSTLEVGQPVQARIAGGQSHSYKIRLEVGQFAHIVVDQQGIDVTVTLLAPDGRSMAEMDSPNLAFGPEPLSIIASSSGDYLLRLKSSEPSAPAGSYRLLLKERREPTPGDQKRADAQSAFGR